MKTRQFYLSLAAGVLLMASCSQEELTENLSMGDGLAKATTQSFTSFDVEDETRSVVDPSTTPIAFKWASGDKLAIYSKTGSGLTNFDLIDGINSEKAIFKANGFSLTEGAQYYAFTPYDGNQTDKTKIAFNYNVQLQFGNGGYERLGDKDFQYSEATMATSEDPNQLTEFVLKHLGAICRFQLTVPETCDLKEFTLSGRALASKGYFNITTGVRTYVAETEGAISVKLGPSVYGGLLVTAGTVLTIYMMVPQQDLSTCPNLTATLTTKDSKSYRAKLTGKNIVGGKAYSWKASPLPTLQGHEYVEIGGKKWATMNVGATTEAGSYATCAGHFFAWGDITPRYSSTGISWSGNKATLSDFSKPYDNSSSLTYTGNTLNAAHDAVTSNPYWGSGWHTPTKQDYLDLYAACGGTGDRMTISKINNSNPTGGIYAIPVDQTFLSEYTGVAGILFVDKTDTYKRVFFPATGYVFGTTHNDGGSNNSLYWTSTLSTSSPNFAYCLQFGSLNAYPSISKGYYYGHVVRPVAD